MMAIDRQQVDDAEEIDLSRCYAKLDRLLDERARRRREVEAAANRAAPDSPWLALKVATGREIHVRDAMDAVGVEALVPTRMGPELRRRGRLMVAQKLPVIIGYVLARCDVKPLAIAGLMGFEDVISLLGGCERPYLITDENISKFNRKAEEGQYDYERPQSLFRIGMRVTVREGIFVGASGRIVSCRKDGKGDAVVEMRFLGGDVPALIPLAILDPM